MAKITKGLLGGFSGKVGTVVGYTLYGIDRMRSLPDRTAPPTANELKNRGRFKLVQEVLNSIKELVKVGFKDYWTVSGGMRAALSYNRKFALRTGADGDHIDPSAFRISGGDLAGLTTPVFVQETAQVLRFNWNPAPVDGGCGYDQVMLLAIDMNGRTASFQSTGNFRSTGTDVLMLSEDLQGKEVDVYIAVVAKDRCSQSNSQYLGKLQLQGSETLLKEEINDFCHTFGLIPTKNTIAYDQPLVGEKSKQHMKEEILNEIKRLGGNTDDVKGLSLKEDLAAITFNHPLYPVDYEDELYGTDKFYEDNKQLYQDSKPDFYKKLIDHFFSDHEIPYGQAFFRNLLFTPFREGTPDFEEWNDIFIDKDEVDLTEIDKVSTDPKPDFMMITYSYGFPDHYYVCLSDQHQENPTVFGTDHEVFFSEVTNEGSLADFFKQFLSKDDFLKIVENYIENEKTDK